MRIRVLIGALLVLTGVVWFFQGIGVLPGSFMTGDPLWAYIGVATGIGGALLMWSAYRR